MIKIGLTGGIGSGKSTVARILSGLGAPVYDSDARSKEILASDPDVIEAVKKLLGEEAYKHGAPDRAYIASLVFSDERALNSLNGILHPAVREDFQNWAEANSDHPYVVMESAILIESGFYGEVNKIVVVTAPEDIRIERSAARDGSSREDVRRRIKAQISEEERIRSADYILYADEKHLLIPQVLELDRKLRETAGQFY